MSSCNKEVKIDSNSSCNKKVYLVAGIPAYNEEKFIAKVILKAKKYVDVVVVVDDGSSDMTAEIAKSLGAVVIRHQKNQGYGAALRTLFQYVKELNPSILVVLDADDQHDPDDIPKLIEPIERGEADVVIGSRFIGKTEQPFWRRIGVKIITWLSKKAHKIPSHITDAQSGFRAYNRNAYSIIEPEDVDMGASIDILYQISKRNLRVVEVPIKIKHHKEGSSQNPITHASRVIMRMLELIIEKKPLLYLGFPGTILTSIGIFAATYVVWVFNQTRYFSVPITLIAISFTFLGVLLVITAFVLYAISNLKRYIKRNSYG